MPLWSFISFVQKAVVWELNEVMKFKHIENDKPLRSHQNHNFSVSSMVEKLGKQSQKQQMHSQKSVGTVSKARYYFHIWFFQTLLSGPGESCEACEKLSVDTVSFECWDLSPWNMPQDHDPFLPL